MGSGCLHREDYMKGNKNPTGLLSTRSTHKGYHFLAATNPHWNSLLETATHCGLHSITSGLLKCLYHIKKLYNSRISQKSLVENIGMLFLSYFVAFSRCDPFAIICQQMQCFVFKIGNFLFTHATNGHYSLYLWNLISLKHAALRILSATT